MTSTVINANTGCMALGADFQKCILGCMPPALPNANAGAARAMNRLILRTAFLNPDRTKNHSGDACGPFRAHMALGNPAITVAGREGPTIAYNRVGGISGATTISRARNVGGQTPGLAEYSGNCKFVSDSSDFVRFKKLAAIQTTYNGPPKAPFFKGLAFVNATCAGGVGRINPARCAF